MSLTIDDSGLIEHGRKIYQVHCQSCHGVKLEGQANWRERGADGKLPAPPHNESGHTWHHPDRYLFQMTKYGIERMLGERYPNNMPAYEKILSDRDILAVLSFIKSTWSKEIQSRHDQINLRTRE